MATDLEYGLPVQARDSVLNVTDTLPKSDVGRKYYLQNMEQKVRVHTKSLISHLGAYRWNIEISFK